MFRSVLTANFCAVQYTHRGNEYTEYQITKDGFVFLAMGFTGKKAAQFKEAYITAFNDMEAQLRTPPNRIDGIPGLTKRDRENLTQAVTVFVDALASQRPLFEIRAVINYIDKAANQFCLDRAVDDMMPFKMERLQAVINDNNVATINNDNLDIRVHNINAGAYKYVGWRLEEGYTKIGLYQPRLL